MEVGLALHVHRSPAPTSASSFFSSQNRCPLNLSLSFFLMVRIELYDDQSGCSNLSENEKSCLCHSIVVISPTHAFCHLNLFFLNSISDSLSGAFELRSISDDSLRRYVYFASENCIQELLSASDTNRADANYTWKILALDNGVEISKRRSGSFDVFRSRWLLKSVLPGQFITVANAIDAAKKWDHDLVEAKYIKIIGDNLSIIRLRFGDSAKPLFKNREFIVYERRETMDDGTLVVAVASLPKEIAAGLQPKGNNAIRGLLLQSGWVVEKLDHDSCMVTYVVQLDPAGWLPKFFVNRLNTRLVMITDDLKKLAQAGAIDGGL